MSMLVTEMSALRTNSLGLSSRSDDISHGNIGNTTVRIFITAVTITTLVILLTEMVQFLPPQFRNVLIFIPTFYLETTSVRDLLPSTKPFAGFS